MQLSESTFELLDPDRIVLPIVFTEENGKTTMIGTYVNAEVLRSDWLGVDRASKKTRCYFDRFEHIDDSVGEDRQCRYSSLAAEWGMRSNGLSELLFGGAVYTVRLSDIWRVIRSFTCYGKQKPAFRAGNIRWMPAPQQHKGMLKWHS